MTQLQPQLRRVKVRSLYTQTYKDGVYWLGGIVDTDSALFDNYVTDANLRRHKESVVADVASVVEREEDYGLFSTPISGFVNDDYIKFMHPITGKLVSLNEVLPILDQVKEIETYQFNTVDGQHRNLAFQRAARRETRINILMGVQHDRVLSAKVAAGLNGGSPVTESTRQNGLGTYEPLKEALGDYAGNVEWMENEKTTNKKIIYGLKDLFMLVRLLKKTDSKVIVSRGFKPETFLLEMAPYRQVLPTMLKIREIIVHQSYGIHESLSPNGIETLPAMEMYEGRSKLGPKRVIPNKPTATLGDLGAHWAMRREFADYLFQSFRNLFILPKEIGDSCQLTLGTEEATLAFVRDALPGLLETLEGRPKPSLTAADFVKKTTERVWNKANNLVLQKLKKGNSGVYRTESTRN